MSRSALAHHSAPISRGSASGSGHGKPLCHTWQWTTSVPAKRGMNRRKLQDHTPAVPQEDAEHMR